MSIHTFGDSHSICGWDGTGAVIHHLGPLLCYSFGKEKLNRCDIRNFNVNHGDTIIFCFGEIDCRAHIHNHINETITYENVIDEIVDDYFEAIKLNVVVSELKLKNICVYNVVPPIEKSDIPGVIFLFVSSDEERKTYCLYFNKKLKEKCVENNYIFFDIYDKYTDNKGFLNKDLSDKGIHIENGVYLTSFIKENDI